MLTLPSNVRILVARESVDFRKSFDGLAGVARDVLAEDPLSGHVFVFLNKRHDRIKILVWDRNGFWLFYKRLERGTFQVIARAQSAMTKVEIEPRELHLLLCGVDMNKVKYRRHFATCLRIGQRGQDAASTTAASHSK